MPDPVKMKPLVRLGNLVGVLLALAALLMIGRFAMLMFQAVSGHPRLVG